MGRLYYIDTQLFEMPSSCLYDTFYYQLLLFITANSR